MAVWRAFAKPFRYAALAAGALPTLAFPQLNLEFLGWCGLVPAILIIRAAPSAREAAVRGWWMGAGFVLAALYWLIPNIGPALLLVAVVFGLLWTGFGVAAWALLRSPLRARPCGRGARRAPRLLGVHRVGPVLAGIRRPVGRAGRQPVAAPPCWPWPRWAASG